MRVLLLTAFVGGVCLLQSRAALPAPAETGAMVAAAVVLLVSAARTRGPARGAACVGAAVLSGVLYAAAQSAARLGDALAFDDEGRDIVVEGLVASLPARLERGWRFEFEVERVVSAGAHVPRRVMLGWYNDPVVVRPAERWRFAVRLKRPHGVLNPGGFDVEAWMLERNLRATGAVRNGRGAPAPERMAARVLDPGALVERARADLRDRLLPRLEGRRYGGVILALIVGDQRAIAAQDWSLFNRTGISHLVSISGLHITMIASLAGGCVAAVWRRTPALVGRAPAQTVGVLAGLAAAIGYALLAGWGIPAQRTVLMLSVVALASFTRVRIGLATALAAAATAVCLVDPWAVLAAGFWLSFGAVAGIVWVVHGRIDDFRVPAWRRALATAARVQLAVTLALVPATVVLFHQLSLVSPLANAVAIPLVSWVVTPLALVGGALAPFDGVAAAAAGLLLAAAHALFEGLAAWLGWLAALPGALPAIATPPWPLTALALAGIAWMLAPPGWPARPLGALLLLPLFVWPAERPRDGELWVTALDIGQGSAVLLETRDRAWLFDTGPRYSADADAGERIVLPYLRHRGIVLLDGLVVSHLDADHSGGTTAILRGVPVRRVLSSIAPAHPLFAARPVERCIAGDRWTDGELGLAVVHPDASDYDRRRTTNAMSCTLVATLGPHRVLLTGDIGHAEEAAIIRRFPALRVDWLAAPHHGSRSSSSALFLSTLGAREAVAQAGYRNRYGHPDPGVASRYAEHGIALARTDHAGALQWRFRADGSVRRSAWRTVGVRYWHNRPGAGAPAFDHDPDDPVEPSWLPLDAFIAG